ncbi:MAG: hypothetical protein ACJ8AG_29125 [Ktedonobacteraceae bacterium]
MQRSLFGAGVGFLLPTDHPLAGSRFVSERLQTPPRSLRLVGKVGLVDDIGLHFF